MIAKFASFLAIGAVFLSTASFAQELPVGTKLGNGSTITGYGVGPNGSPVYKTTKGVALQSVVNRAVTKTQAPQTGHGSTGIISNNHPATVANPANTKTNTPPPLRPR